MCAAHTIYRNIIISTIDGGSPDPTLNLQLASVLSRAKEQDVPKDNIERALAKACFIKFRPFPFSVFDKAGGGKEKVGESLTYEALAHNSVGLIM